MKLSIGKRLLLVVGIAVASLPVADADAEVCASADEAAVVRQYYVENPEMLPFVAARSLGVSEAVVLSALPKEQAIGVDPGAFQSIWAELVGIDNVSTTIFAGGSIFEVHGKIPSGTPSSRSNYFNLESEEGQIGGHLRPDLIASIYVVHIAVGNRSDTIGVSFIDGNGDAIFGVYLSGAEVTPTDENLAKAHELKKLAMSLPSACEAGTLRSE